MKKFSAEKKPDTAQAPIAAPQVVEIPGLDAVAVVLADSIRASGETVKAFEAIAAGLADKKSSSPQAFDVEIVRDPASGLMSRLIVRPATETK